MKKLIVLAIFLGCLFSDNLSAQSEQRVDFEPGTTSSESNGTAPDTSEVFRLREWKSYYFGGLLVGQSVADSLNFLVSLDNVTYYNLNDALYTSESILYVELDSSVASAKGLNEQAFKGWEYFKIITDVGAGSISTADTFLVVSKVRRSR